MASTWFLLGGFCLPGMLTLPISVAFGAMMCLGSKKESSICLLFIFELPYSFQIIILLNDLCDGSMLCFWAMVNYVPSIHVWPYIEYKKLFLSKLWVFFLEACCLGKAYSQSVNFFENLYTFLEQCKYPWDSLCKKCLKVTLSQFFSLNLHCGLHIYWQIVNRPAGLCNLKQSVLILTSQLSKHKTRAAREVHFLSPYL